MAFALFATRPSSGHITDASSSYRPIATSNTIPRDLSHPTDVGDRRLVCDAWILRCQQRGPSLQFGRAREKPGSSKMQRLRTHGVVG